MGRYNLRRHTHSALTTVRLREPHTSHTRSRSIAHWQAPPPPPFLWPMLYISRVPVFRLLNVGQTLSRVEVTTTGAQHIALLEHAVVHYCRWSVNAATVRIAPWNCCGTKWVSCRIAAQAVRYSRWSVNDFTQKVNPSSGPPAQATHSLFLSRLALTRRGHRHRTLGSCE